MEGAIKMGSWTFGICSFIGILLWLFQPSGARSFRALRKALANADSLIRAGAAYELGCMGSNAVDALADLKALNFDTDDTVRIWARWAVDRISPTGL